MDDILEFILELILDGSMEAVTSRKVPMALRILGGIIVGFVYTGLLVLMLMLTVSGIRNGDTALILVGLGCVALVLAGAHSLVKRIRGRK